MCFLAGQRKFWEPQEIRSPEWGPVGAGTRI